MPANTDSALDHWSGVYRRRRPSQVSWFQACPEPSLDALDRFGADPGSSLVDVGGGASSLVDALLDRGWTDITILDIAEEALEASRVRLGRRAGLVSWKTADIGCWRPDRPRDIWHDRALFHFLTNGRERQAYREALDAGTRPGSLVIIATFAPDGPESCSGLPVQRHDPLSLSKELGAAFRLLDGWREDHVTPQGRRQAFNWCAFRRDG